jgi:hypothetical protein
MCGRGVFAAEELVTKEVQCNVRHRGPQNPYGDVISGRPEISAFEIRVSQAGCKKHWDD